MTGRLRRVGVRSRLLLAVGSALAVALAIGVLGFSLILKQRLTASATSLARAQAEAEASALDVRAGKLVPPRHPSGAKPGAQVWIFSQGRALERPRVDEELDAQASRLAAGLGGKLSTHEARLYGVPVIRGGKRYGAVVAAVSLDAYKESEDTAVVASVLFALALLAGMLVLTRSILGRALMPVSRMTKDAAAWSEQDIDRRFELGEPYDELTRLASTLDGLLDRLAASLRHEQRLTAELSHELRTPLARISAEAELALSRPRGGEDYRASLVAIRRNADQMARTVDALVAAARHETRLHRTSSDARTGVQSAVDAVLEPAEAHGIDVRLTLPPHPLLVSLDADLMERIVQPVLDNALRYGKGVVSVELAENGSTATVTVRDDGPGLTGGEEGLIFEPGQRGSAAGSTTGAGLGLPLVRRLARSAGGDVTVENGPGGGGAFTIRIPLA